jgi:hypothetical protein
MCSPRGKRVVVSSPQAWLSWPWVRPTARSSSAPEKFTPDRVAPEKGALQIGADEAGVGQVGA